MVHTMAYELAYSQIVLLARTSLTTLGAKHQFKDEALTRFVNENVDNIAAATYCWYAMFTSVDRKWHDKVMDAGADIFDQVDRSLHIADELIDYLRRHTTSPEFDTHVELRKILSALRFPKRTALIGATWLDNAAQNKFFTTINANPASRWKADLAGWSNDPAFSVDTLDSRFIDPFSPYVHDQMITTWRKWLKVLLPPVSWFKLEDINQFSFPTGAVQDACTNPVCKWYRTYVFRDQQSTSTIKEGDPVAGRNYMEEWMRHGLRWKHIPPFSPEADAIIFASNTVSFPDAYIIHPITVPKQLSAVRTIAMENAYNSQVHNYLGKRLVAWWKKKGLLRLFAHLDQDINRAKAIDGSRDGTWDTTDCSAASDTIRRYLIYCLQNPTLNFLLGFMPTHVKWGKRFQRLPIYGTMGSVLTFLVEEVIFLLVGLYSVAEKMLYDTGVFPGLGYLIETEAASCVGDDLTTKGGAGATALDILELIGCKPNASKSFVDGHFRESCGAEGWCGYRVDGPYWPRGLDVTKLGDAHWDGFKEEYTSGVTALVNLHNHLVYDFQLAAERVVQVISSYHDPDRFSYPGTDIGLNRNAPIYRYENTCSEGDTPSRPITYSSVILEDPKLLPMLEMVSLEREPAKPKSTCWCCGLPDTIYKGLEERWVNQYYSENGAPVVDPFFGAEYNQYREVVKGTVTAPTSPIPRLGRMSPVYRIKDQVLLQTDT